MGRRSLGTARKKEVMEAYLQCIREYGLQRTTLDQIAEKAGMTRGLVRHYVGNREEMVQHFIDYLIPAIQDQFTDELAAPTDNRIERLVQVLFSPRDDFYVDKVIVDALINGKDHFPGVQERLARVFENMLQQIVGELCAGIPQLECDAAQKLAYGLFCLSMAQDTMVWLEINPGQIHYGEEIARFLIRSATGVTSKYTGLL
jgi:AcrR family transcriptional regulator